MKFLKKIFGLNVGLNGRLNRTEYLFLGVLPMIGLIFLIFMSIEMNFNLEKYLIIILILLASISFIAIFILAVVSAVKRGRDSGLNGLVTLFLFGAIPVIVIILMRKLQIDFVYVAFLFIIYLLIMPSSQKDLKRLGKVEYIFMIIGSFFIFIIFGPNCLCSVEKEKIDKAKIDLVCVNMKGNANALKMFKLDNGVYPTTAEGNSALILNPNILKYPNYSEDAYLEKLPKDSWGKEMVYLKTKDGFEIISYGADRKEGGEDEYADIFYSECK